MTLPTDIEDPARGQAPDYPEDVDAREAEANHHELWDYDDSLLP